MSIRRSALALPLALAACTGPAPEARYLVEVPWSVAGIWLRADLHSHSRHSDGELAVNELAALAARGGCDVLAITDHGEPEVAGPSPAAYADIAEAAKGEPRLLLLAGMEWNVPPYGGREHMGVLMPAAAQDSLLEFRRRFEASGAKAEDALRWLADSPAGKDAVLVYNHPSRKDADALENERDLAAWQAVNALVRVVEGGPGHQKAAIPGDYGSARPTQERWDPFVAEVGGAWDRLLEHDRAPWAALASSDYHREGKDEAPCAFARTHVHAPARSEAGVFAALKAGAFWAEHGRMLDALDFRLEAQGLDVPAHPGETVAAPRGLPLKLVLELKPGPGAGASGFQVELIGNGGSGQPELLYQASLAAGATALSWQAPEQKPGADGRSIYFRTRVSTLDGQGQRLWAYTNPIRVVLE